MSQPVWPERREAAALCRLLCRPAPPLVAAQVLRRAGSLTALLLQRPAAGIDPALEAGLRAGIERWRRDGGALVTFYDVAYPELLRQIARPPLALFARGDVACLSRPVVAIVGARAATVAARAWTAATAGDLGRCGIVVASGLARGIDAAAHRGALDAGGETIAVLGCGPDLCYPPEHAALAARIAVAGCVASEYPPGTPPRRWHFPMRNRILSGLAAGVVVVQAEPKSGALITALQALEENRQVMAVPGDVADPRSRGPHTLLRQGATLVDGAADILAGLDWLPREATPHPEGRHDDSTSLAPAAAALYGALGAGLDFEALRARLGWSAAAVQQTLTELEIAGLVERAAGGAMWVPRRGEPRDRATSRPRC